MRWTCFKSNCCISVIRWTTKAFAAEVVFSFECWLIQNFNWFSTSGALLADVLAWKQILGEQKAIKASGGIRTKQDALNFIEAGALWIGTSNAVNFFKK